MQRKRKSKRRGFFSTALRIFFKIILYGFLFSILYILFCKWIDPPITITQLNSVLSGKGLKRSYVDINSISPNLKLAVLCSEDQLFPDHNGFDFKVLKKL